MAGRGGEIGVAYYSLVPSMDGTTAVINQQLGGITAAGAAAGQRGGAALGAGIVGGLKAAGAVGVALGAVGLVGNITDYFSQATTKASDLQESANALGVTFGQQAAAISELGETAATRLGLSRIAFNQLATRFSAFAGTIAGEGGDVVSVIDDLTTRGADFASVFNIDVDEALSLFQSGLAGETEPLRRFGIDLSAAAVEAFAAANGIGAQGRALTEAEKVQARYGLLLQQTAKTQGDFARTSDSLANSQRIANARFEDAQARIGEALLPAAEKFSAWMLEDGVPLVEKLVDAFIDAEPAITATVDGFIALLDTGIGFTEFYATLFGGLADGKLTIDEIRDAFQKLPDPIKEALAGVGQTLLDTMVGVYNFGASGLNALIGFINGFLSGLRPVVSFLNSVFGTNYTVPQLGNVALLGSASFRDLLFNPGSSAGGSRTSRPGSNIALAEGAVVPARPGGLDVTVSEGRYDEAIIPLSPGVLREIGAGIAGQGDSPIVFDGSIVGVLRRVAGQEARIILNDAVASLTLDMRAGSLP